MKAYDYNEGIEKNDDENEDLESSLATYEVITYPADFTLEGLVAKYKKGAMLIPGFQRNYVWSIKQASRLIESFLLGLPVPAIFLFTDDNNAQLVLDGQQRLMSLVYYFDGYFGEESTSGRKKVFRLTGLNSNSPYYNKTYEELKNSDEVAFNKLNDSVLRAFIVKQLTPNGNTSVYHIFERLNTGGTHLVGQEIRNCVYHGSFNDMLFDLNNYENWRLIFGSPAHKRQKDLELILRFLSLYERFDEYERPIKDFMSNYMKDNQNLNQDKINSFKELFKLTCDFIIQNLGEKPFHIWSGMNVAVFDSVFTTVAKNLNNPNLNLTKERFKSLTEDVQFIQSVRGTTTDEKNIRTRFKLTETYLINNE